MMIKLTHELSCKVCNECLKDHEKDNCTCVWLSIENEYCPMLLILEQELLKNDK